MADHHPPHIYLDRTWYMISANTRGNEPLLASDEAKTIFRETLKTLVTRQNVALRAWVILDNHYHLLLKTDNGHGLSHFVGQLHGSASMQINEAEGVAHRLIWHNYWDSCIRTEADMWTRFNYIHQNPVKHGYVSRLEDWPFSSYNYYLRTKGEEWLQDCWLRYPVIDFVAGDDFGSATSSTG